MDSLVWLWVSGEEINAQFVTLQDFIYPEGVAYGIGGPGNPQYGVIEMHYDNPDRDNSKLYCCVSAASLRVINE